MFCTVSTVVTVVGLIISMSCWTTSAQCTRVEAEQAALCSSIEKERGVESCTVEVCAKREDL